LAASQRVPAGASAKVEELKINIYCQARYLLQTQYHEKGDRTDGYKGGVETQGKVCERML